jgi:hypothetical protein
LANGFAFSASVSSLSIGFPPYVLIGDAYLSDFVDRNGDLQSIFHAGLGQLQDESAFS